MKSYALREMNESDLKWVLKWRNSKWVREASGSSKRITMDQHRYWFDCSTNSLKLVFTEDQKPKGVIIYDRESSFWSFYLDPSLSPGSGLARLMLSLFLVYAKEIGIKTIKAKIQGSNVVSQGLHKSLGFWLNYITMEYQKDL